MTGFAEKLAVVPTGRPDAVKLTGSLKPAKEVRSKVKEAVASLQAATVEGLAAKTNVGTAGSSITKF